MPAEGKPGGLSGRVALVTGANHGIGAATAVELAARGARVLVAYLRLEDPPDSGVAERYRTQRAGDATDVVEAIEKLGGRAVAVEADLADPATPARLFDRAEAELGPVDILVNNASAWVADTFAPASGGRFGHSVQAMSAETFDRLFAVDARAAALLIGELARRQAARGASWGRIVGLISGGPLGFPGDVSYGAAKAAQTNYTMSAALELAPLGITANVVQPGVTDTGWVNDEVRAFVRDRPEMVHVASPEEVARTVAWLVSDEAFLVTGNTLYLR